MQESRLFRIIYYLLEKGEATASELAEKLSALFHVSTENWYEVDFSRWGEQKQDNEKFESLKNAIIHHHLRQCRWMNG